MSPSGHQSAYDAIELVRKMTAQVEMPCFTTSAPVRWHFQTVHNGIRIRHRAIPAEPMT